LARVVPFEAFHYDTRRFGQDLTRFMAPPYDVIDGETERRLKDDRLNIAHLTLGDEDDGYATARKRLARWINDGVLVRDEGPAFYLYEQTFKGPDGEPIARSGIIGLVRLEEFSKGVILPHEKTMPKHKADRLALMKAAEGDLEQIFMLYEDPEGAVEGVIREARKAEELLRFIDTDGVHHRIVRLDDPGRVKTITGALEKARLLIADGHHRYETSLEYRDIVRGEVREADGELPCDFVMTTLVSSSNPGLVVYPTHRLIRVGDGKRLEGMVEAVKAGFRTTSCDGPEALAKAVAAGPADGFGVWVPSIDVSIHAWPAGEAGGADPMARLSVHVLQEQVLKGILGYTDDALARKQGVEYVKGTGATMDMMAEGEYDACFFVRPPTVPEVMAVSATGERMPQKSTYFYPKIWSGTLLYLFR
jgi:uncharacterized protein (DUF1015 family)